MTSTPVEELAEAFVELADTVADEFDLDDFLDLMASRCVRLLDVPAAALLLMDHGGRARTTGASGERARVLALIGEGPGPDCCRGGEPVIVPDLTTVTPRWPEFAAAAAAAGFEAAHAVPMRRQAQVIGALTLFSAVRGELDKVTDRVAQALADIATIGLLQAWELRRREELAAQLQHALTSRIVIEQAKGVAGERLGLSMDAAFSSLRSYARSNNLRISEVAASVVDGSFDLVRLPGI